MNNKNVFWGVLLVVIGALFIFDNLGVFDFSFRALFDMWPALLVIWGISLLPLKGGLKTILSVAVVVLAIFVGAQKDYSSHWSNNFGRHIRFNNSNWNDKDVDESINISSVKYSFTEDFDETIETAVFNMELAAGKFRIEDTTDFLIDFEAENTKGLYTHEIMKNGPTSEVYVRLEDGNFRTGTNKHRVAIKLNTTPNWEMKLDMGAADFVGDLRKFKVSKVEIDGGASSIKLKIGDKQMETHIDIESGASAVKIYIPASAGCELVSNSVLSDLDLSGFIKEGDKYRTSNFEEATQKIYVNLDSAISALNVIREEN